MKLKNINYQGNLEFKAPPRLKTNVLIFTSDGSDLVTVNARGRLYARNTTHTNTITTINEDLDRNVYSGSVDSTVKKFDSEGNQLWNYTEIPGEVTSIFATPGSNYVYVGTSSGQLARLDATDGTQLWRVQPKTATPIKHVTTSVDSGVYVIIGSTLLSIDSSDGSILWEMTQHASTINDISTTTDGDILTVDNSGVIKKTSVEGTVLQTESIHTGALVSVEFGINGNVHALGSNGKLIQMSDDLVETNSFNINGTSFSGMEMDHMGRYFIKVDGIILCLNQVGQAQWQSNAYAGDALYVTRLPVMISPVITEYSFVELLPPTNLQAF